VYKKILPVLKIKFKYKSFYEIPQVTKAVINVSFKSNLSKEVILQIKSQLQNIVGQKFYLIKAKKSISNFQLRKNSAIALKSTLRGVFMYNFLQKLIHVALPRIKDFRGYCLKRDSKGNLNIGINDYSIFPDISFENSYTAGFNLSVVFKSTFKFKGREEHATLKYLNLLKFPFKN
jgi:large subunit ribosomal protein L5